MEAGGAGAGIGGDGGNGGTSKKQYVANKGEKGEDCGIIVISNDLEVYAYGGSGGSGGGDSRGGSVQSGGGGRRLSSCRNRRPEELAVLQEILVLRVLAFHQEFQKHIL